MIRSNSSKKKSRSKENTTPKLFNQTPTSQSNSKKFKSNNKKETVIKSYNGFNSAENPKFKRKSHKNIEAAQYKDNINIDMKKIDNTVDELWLKFVMYYNYEEVFKIKEVLDKHPNKESIINSSKKKSKVDFDIKLQTLFNIYKIKKDTNDNNITNNITNNINNKDNLISSSEEGSYLLKHAKIWIIYIKNLKEHYDYKFRELFQIFNYALEYGTDEYMLFDYFITIAQEFDEDEVLQFDKESFPEKFVELYNSNKELIMKTLKEEESSLDNQNNNEVIDEECNNDTLIVNNNLDEVVHMSFADNANGNGGNNNEPHVEFSFSREIKVNTDIDDNSNIPIKENVEVCVNNKENIIEIEIKNEIKNIQEDNILGSAHLDNLQIESVQQQTENNIEEDIDDIKVLDKYLISTPDKRISVITEKSQESENATNEKNILQSVKKINEKIAISLNSLKNVELNNANNIHNNVNNTNNISNNLFTPNSKNKKLKEDELDEAFIANSNIRNSGNLAVLELSAKSQGKVGHKYVLTPLKESFQNLKEREALEVDLNEVRSKYSNFIYHPYDEEIINKIKDDEKEDPDTNNKASNRLTFG